MRDTSIIISNVSQAIANCRLIVDEIEDADIIPEEIVLLIKAHSMCVLSI